MMSIFLVFSAYSGVEDCEHPLCLVPFCFDISVIFGECEVPHLEAIFASETTLESARVYGLARVSTIPMKPAVSAM